MPPELTILKATDRWVAIDKPSGLCSVPGVGPDSQDNARARLQELYPNARGAITVHRLDMDTSGVLLMALDEPTHRALSIQFQDREVAKRYVALLHGHLDRDAGVIELPLRPDLTNRPYQIVDFDQGKPAQTRYRVLECATCGTLGRVTRVEFEPITGRSHQLRVHAAARATIVHNGAPRPGGLHSPIVGDNLYSQRDTPSAARLMLHAEQLTFTDPVSGDRVRIASSVPF
ncbi:MAG: RluA family pseudouridine synthase [Planctomycetota bacterium]